MRKEVPFGSGHPEAEDRAAATTADLPASAAVAKAEDNREGVSYRRAGDKDSRPDAMRLYLSEVGYKPLLTAEQEVEYAREAQRGDEGSKLRIVESNLRLVVKIAARYRWRGLSFGDLIEEGNLGLLRAVEKFDPERGFRFSTYASWWIRQKIEYGLMYQARIIRLPAHVIQEMNVVARAQRHLRSKFGREPTVAEIAGRTCKSRTIVEKLLELSNRIFSADSALSDMLNVPYTDLLSDQSELGPVDSHGQQQLRERLSAWMRELTPRQRDVLRRRFGLEGHSCDTLERVGSEVGLTRERTRQVQVEALRKLKRIVVRDGLASDVLREFD